ncbi:hypothetical protein HQ531_14335 [bacterium]|nr:hypothetical protein [bacterium]
MNLSESFELLLAFSGNDLTQRLSIIEESLKNKTAMSIRPILASEGVNKPVLEAAGQIKQVAGQIHVIIHAVGILLTLPELLSEDEVIESLSLGAGNTGRDFDLETTKRIAEFKFIRWHGGSESIRQNSLFKDFYMLAESDTIKSKYLYVLGTEIPLKFFNGKRAISSVFSKNVSLLKHISDKHPSCRVVSDYYLKHIDEVEIVNIMPYLQGFDVLTQV